LADAISDTSPIQYLFQVGVLDLLPRLFRAVLVPPAVVGELRAGRELGHSLPDVDALDWVIIRPARNTASLGLAHGLGDGEREALALALENRGTTVVLDDALARRVARSLRLQVVGTLGILLRAKRSGLLAEVLPVLDRLEALRFRLDLATRVAVLNLAGETDIA
jgi:predicted nucleic acid-binding protein